MNRKPWEELLFLYLTGTLSKEDRADFERYLAESENYRAELDEWRELTDAVQSEADSRVDHLPALTPVFYQRLQAGSPPSLNGSTHVKERKTVNITQIRNLEYPQSKSLPQRSFTLAAALVAVVAFAAVFIFANSPKPDGDLALSGPQLQQETATPFPVATIVGTEETQEMTEPINLTATALVEDTTQRAVATALPQTFTPTPVPANIWPETATPFPWGGDPTMLPPTVVPPLMSITPSQIEPIVSFPARIVQEARMPIGDASRGLAWSPDGKTIAVAGYNGSWVFNADHISGAARLFPDNGFGIVEVAFSADSSLLATLNSAQTLRIWDVETGIQLAEMPEAPLWDDLQFSADAQYLISKNSNQKISLQGLQDGILEKEQLISADLNGYYALLSPDGETLAAYNNNGSILVLDFETAEMSASFDWPAAFTWQAAFSRNGQWLAIGGDKEVVVVDASGGGYHNSMNTLGMVNGLSFSADDSMLAASMRSDTIHSLWLMNLDPANSFNTAIFVYDLPLVNPVFSPTGNQLALGTEDGRLFILEVNPE